MTACACVTSNEDEDCSTVGIDGEQLDKARPNWLGFDLNLWHFTIQIIRFLEISEIVRAPGPRNGGKERPVDDNMLHIFIIDIHQI